MEIRGPEGLLISIETADGWSPLRPGPLRVGLVVGQAYRLRVGGIAADEGLELFPSIRPLAKLAAPPGMAWRSDVVPAGWFDVRPGDDALDVARTLGEPVAELVIGNRTPAGATP